ncbi:MAG: hypothetical protein M1835_006692 [Candelina submexicana]|nr:MAG: hypothetical protein M1835_006692 [Candelina submexicana]
MCIIDRFLKLIAQQQRDGRNRVRGPYMEPSRDLLVAEQDQQHGYEDVCDDEAGYVADAADVVFSSTEFVIEWFFRVGGGSRVEG